MNRITTLFNRVCFWHAGLVALGLFFCVPSAPASPPKLDDLYKPGPDSMKQDGVPSGKIIGPLTLPSNVFTNTTRNYWIYVPAQYDPAIPACLMIFQDGHAFVNTNGEYRVPTVCDNLIYRREMPVTICVFINPGHTPSQTESTDQEWGDRSNNRALEYNDLNDDYTRLIVDELLPAIQKDYRISPRPEDRAVGGASSGAICAFTVAWHRPDQFGKVISCIGSFTDLRGGHVYPDLIRQSERKPIRIYLQDGVNDNRGRGRTPESPYNPKRDWHAQNIKMVAALTEKGYDVNYCWGIGTHSGKQGGAIMPEMLRWIWRDYPRTDDPADDSNRKPFDPAPGSSGAVK
jgi:enterochelin esterase family protein